MATLPPSVVGMPRLPPPRLVVVVQPNQNQKRRYNSDGPTRGQIKDDSGERVPTVRLDNYHRPCLMYMMACSSNGEPHPFFELQSVDKCGCKPSSLDGRPAVITETSPDKDMEARFAACLKRLAMRQVQEASEFLFTKWKCESEKVHLGFLAVALPAHEPLASCLSNPIHMVQGRLLEMKKIIPGSGPWDVESIVCITGKNFPACANLKVRFFHANPESGEKWESYGDVDSNDSSEKHLVITVPRGPTMNRDSDTVQVGVEILPGTATQTRQKGRHLYFSYISPATGTSPKRMMTSLELMRNSLAEVRQGAQSLLETIEPSPYTSAIGTALHQNTTMGLPPRTGHGPAPGHMAFPIRSRVNPGQMLPHAGQGYHHSTEEKMEDTLGGSGTGYGNHGNFQIKGERITPGKRRAAGELDGGPMKLAPPSAATYLTTNGSANDMSALHNGTISLANEMATVAPTTGPGGTVVGCGGVRLNHDASASGAELFHAFSPDRFSTAAERSPGSAIMHGMSMDGMEGYAASQPSPMLGQSDDAAMVSRDLVNDLLLHPENYPHESYMFMNPPGPGTVPGQ